MSVNRVVLNETSYFGFGSRSVLADEIKTRGFKKILVVTDKDLVKFHVVDQVTAVLDDAGIAYQVFSDVKQNPTVKNVKDGLAALKVSGAEALLGVGGDIHFKTDNRPLFDFSLIEFEACEYGLTEVSFDLHAEDAP